MCLDYIVKSKRFPFTVKLCKCQEVKDHIHVQVCTFVYYFLYDAEELTSKLFTVTIISFSYIRNL